MGRIRTGRLIFYLRDGLYGVLIIEIFNLHSDLGDDNEEFTWKDN